MADQQVGFIREEHALLSLGKKVKKLNEKALRVLEDGLSDPDIKVRMECAKTLLKMDVDISKIINEDSVNRLLLELKQNGNPEPKDITPLVDFGTIQDI